MSGRAWRGLPWSIRVRMWWLERVHGGLNETRRLGYLGEAWAGRYLRGEGYRVMGRNVVTEEGEADLVCRAPDGAYVVVEVKTRRRGLGAEGVGMGVGMGAGVGIPPEASVGVEKRRRLRRIARELGRVNGWGGAEVRVEVVAIEWAEGREPVVRHWRGIG